MSRPDRTLASMDTIVLTAGTAPSPVKLHPHKFDTGAGTFQFGLQDGNLVVVFTPMSGHKKKTGTLTMAKDGKPVALDNAATLVLGPAADFTRGHDDKINLDFTIQFGDKQSYSSTAQCVVMNSK